MVFSAVRTLELFPCGCAFGLAVGSSAENAFLFIRTGACLMITYCLTFEALVDLRVCFAFFLRRNTLKVCLIEIDTLLQKSFLLLFLFEEESNHFSRLVSRAAVDSFKGFIRKLLPLKDFL